MFMWNSTLDDSLEEGISCCAGGGKYPLTLMSMARSSGAVAGGAAPCGRQPIVGARIVLGGSENRLDEAPAPAGGPAATYARGVVAAGVPPPTNAKFGRPEEDTGTNHFPTYNRNQPHFPSNIGPLPDHKWSDVAGEVRTLNFFPIFFPYYKFDTVTGTIRKSDLRHWSETGRKPIPNPHKPSTTAVKQTRP